MNDYERNRISNLDLKIQKKIPPNESVAIQKNKQSILTTTGCLTNIVPHLRHSVRHAQLQLLANFWYLRKNNKKNVKIKHSNPYICTSSAIKLNWLLLHKNAVQLLINTNKGFMYKTKTESICFTNRNSEGIEFFYKILIEFLKDSALTNSLTNPLLSAKYWRKNLNENRILVEKADGFSC